MIHEVDDDRARGSTMITLGCETSSKRIPHVYVSDTSGSGPETLDSFLSPCVRHPQQEQRRTARGGSTRHQQHGGSDLTRASKRRTEAGALPGTDTT